MGRAQKIKNRIKNSSFFGGAYLITVGAFVKILQLFIRPNENKSCLSLIVVVNIQTHQRSL